MGLGDSIKKLVGIEEYDDELEEITEEDVQATREKVEKRNSRKEKEAKKEAKRESERETITERRASSSSKPADRRYSMAGTGTFKLIVLEPKTFEECPKLVDSLKTRKPVIINLEKLDTDVARKIFDFLSGATYALNGNVQKVANNIFIFAPENVDIAGGSGPEKPGFDYNSGDSSAQSASSANSPWK